MKIALASLFRRAHHKQIVLNVEDELHFHIEMLERKYAQQGMSTADARAAALRRFGNLEKIRKQCVDISRRSSLLRRVLKTSTILIALSGLAIHVLNSNLKITRIGTVLIMIAVSGRLLLYVRGLSPSAFLHRTKQSPLSVTDTPEEA